MKENNRLFLRKKFGYNFYLWKKLDTALEKKSRKKIQEIFDLIISTWFDHKNKNKNSRNWKERSLCIFIYGKKLCFWESIEYSIY